MRLQCGLMGVAILAHGGSVGPQSQALVGIWYRSRGLSRSEQFTLACTALAALPTSYYGRVTLPCKLRLDANVIPQQTTQSSLKFRLCIAFHRLFGYSQTENAPSNFRPTEGCREVSCTSRCTLQARYKHRGTEGA